MTTQGSTPQPSSTTTHGGLQIRGVAKSFGTDTHVLREIDLEVEPGEMVSLVGASGTGKSTLLRIIAGLEEGRVATPINTDSVITSLNEIIIKTTALTFT